MSRFEESDLVISEWFPKRCDATTTKARSAHLLEGPNKEKALHYQKERGKLPWFLQLTVVVFFFFFFFFFNECYDGCIIIHFFDHRII